MFKRGNQIQATHQESLEGFVKHQFLKTFFLWFISTRIMWVCLIGFPQTRTLVQATSHTDSNTRPVRHTHPLRTHHTVKESVNIFVVSTFGVAPHALVCHPATGATMECVRDGSSRANLACLPHHDWRGCFWYNNLLVYWSGKIESLNIFSTLSTAVQFMLWGESLVFIFLFLLAPRGSVHIC